MNTLTSVRGGGFAFGWTLRFLSALASIASLVLLMKHGFAIGFHAPLQRILDEYEFWVRVLFASWAEPLLIVALAYLRDLTGLTITLVPEWKYIFIPTWFYLAGGLRIDQNLRGYLMAAFTVVWGTTSALIAAVLFSALSQGNATYRAFAGLAPILCLVLYELVRRIWIATFYRPAEERWSVAFQREFRTYVIPVAVIGMGMLVLAVLLNLIFDPVRLKAPGLILLMAFITLLSLYWLIRGVRRTPHYRTDGDSWSTTFLRSGSARLAIYLLTTIAGTIAFLLANAGIGLIAR